MRWKTRIGWRNISRLEEVSPRDWQSCVAGQQSQILLGSREPGRGEMKNCFFHLTMSVKQIQIHVGRHIGPSRLWIYWAEPSLTLAIVRDWEFSRSSSPITVVETRLSCRHSRCEAVFFSSRIRNAPFSRILPFFLYINHCEKLNQAGSSVKNWNYDKSGNYGCLKRLQLYYLEKHYSTSLDQCHHAL